MNNNNMISVIVPLYKGGRYVTSILEMIEENIKKLMQEMNIYVELIFVNDFPKENILVQHDVKYKVTILDRKANKGVHASRVDGFYAAQGEYILFLDQDDTIKPEYLISQMKHIGNKDAVLCNGIYRKNRLIYSESMPQKEAVDVKYCISRQNKIISPGQVVIRKSAIPKEWLENIFNYNGLDDSFLWLLMLKKNRTFALNKEILYIHNEDGENASFEWEKMGRSKREMQKIVKKLKLLNPQEQEQFDKKMNFSLNKTDSYIRLDELWKKLEAKNQRIAEYLNKCGYKTIAIYGMGIYGTRLYEELEESAVVHVCYGIDQNADAIQGYLKIIQRDEEYPAVDIIVNSATFLNDEIKKFIASKTSAEVIGLDELLERAIERVS